MKRHLVTFVFLLLAMTFYGVGAAGPATGLLVLGGLAEATFWFRIVGNRRKRR